MHPSIILDDAVAEHLADLFFASRDFLPGRLRFAQSQHKELRLNAWRLMAAAGLAGEGSTFEFGRRRPLLTGCSRRSRWCTRRGRRSKHSPVSVDRVPSTPSTFHGQSISRYLKKDPRTI